MEWKMSPRGLSALHNLLATCQHPGCGCFKNGSQELDIGTNQSQQTVVGNVGEAGSWSIPYCTRTIGLYFA